MKLEQMSQPQSNSRRTVNNGIHNNGDDAGYSAPGKYRSTIKPSIASIEKVTLTSDRVSKSSIAPNNQNHREVRGNPTLYESERTEEGDSNGGNTGNNNRKRKLEQMSQPQSNSRRRGRYNFRPKEDRRERRLSEDPDNPPVKNLKRREIASAPLENRVDDEIESGDSDSVHEDEQGI